MRALLLFLATTQAWSATRLNQPTKLVQGRAAARALKAADEAAAVEEVPRGGFKSWFISNRTPLLFGALVGQKVLADVVTDYTRRQGAYSGATVSMLSEVAKFPVLVAAICAFAGGPSRLWPTVKRAYSDTPFKIAWIAGAYAAQNVLYFAALGRISAASYQVLSQSKMIFTAILAVTMLKEKLRKRDIAALVCLLGGSTLVQLSEMAGAGAGKGGAEALLGGGFAVLGALLSAVPNVWYEKLLKTPGEDEWARNVQVTVWIFSWIALSQLWTAASAVRAGLAGAVDPFASLPNFGRALFGSFEGLTPAVWLVVALKSLNGILIPATLKYAGNLVYLYAKPTSIVMTALASAVYSSTVPPASFCAGAALVIWSMANFKK